MTTIKVTPEQLLSVSKQFASAQSQIAQMNHILKQQLFEIERQWNGSTKERFYADFIAAQRVMDNFCSLSLSIAKTLEGHAEKFRLADQQTTQSYDANCMPPPPDECRAPTVDNRNAFQKSVDSLKELGTGFIQAADDRYQKRYDSVGGFLDYWTFGIPSGLVEGYMDRADKAFNSANDTANWLTFGIHGTIREAIFPTNAWSSEHWANMMGMGGMMVGGGLTAKMIKPHNLLTSSGGGAKVGILNQRPGTGQMTGGFNGFKDPRLQVMDNITESKKARESSKFSEYVEKEKVLGKYNYKKVEEVESRFRHESKEHGQFFDKNGNLVGDTVIGTEKSIDISNYRDRGKEAVFTHNHPNNGPFSLEDIMVAVDFDMLEMRAVTPNGKTFSMVKGIEGWKVDGPSVRMVYRLVQEELRADVGFNKLYKEGRMDEAWEIFYDKIAGRIGGDYKRH